MAQQILLSSDLDRTILPNGAQPESPEAREHLGTLAVRPEVRLAYVSGRHRRLIQQAIEDYDIPVPNFAIGDVGTTIYHIEHDQWYVWENWSEAIAPDWNGATPQDLERVFHDLDELRLQEPEKQNTFKLSYYTPEEVDHRSLVNEMYSRLEARNVNASLIWSIDEAAHLGLLDVLPASATKLHAVEFLMQEQGFEFDNTVFAGDSGNDLPVVVSGRLQSVLVKNAHADVVTQAEAALEAIGQRQRLYVAQGGFLGMNGHYSAGVLEGLAHFCPWVRGWFGT
jgi:HAD superfamily hydrolase (TIGR01484 family)